jgi:hypothetical protein
MSSSPRQRSGAHRPRRRPGAVVVPLLLTVLVVVAVLVGLRVLSQRQASTSDAARPAASASPTPSSSPAPSPTGATSTPSTPSSEPADVDRSARVTVLNASGRAGLATRAAATLRSAGWTVGSTGNYPKEQPSTVYYSGTDLRETARAVSADLPGTQRVQRSTEFGDAAVTVVLGPDYSG